MKGLSIIIFFSIFNMLTYNNQLNHNNNLLKNLTIELKSYNQLYDNKLKLINLERSLHLTKEQRKNLNLSIHRYLKRINLTKKIMIKKKKKLKQLIAINITGLGILNEANPTPNIMIFDKLETIQKEYYSLKNSYIHIQQELKEMKNNYKELGKVIKVLHEKIDNKITQIRRLNEEIWRLSRLRENKKNIFDARHFKILAKINKLKKSIKKLGTNNVILPLPTKGWPISKTNNSMLLSVKPGAIIFAPGDGIVLLSGKIKGRGEGIIILHDNGMISIILDLGKIFVKKGEKVKFKTPIGMAPFAPFTKKNARVNIYFSKRVGG